MQRERERERREYSVLRSCVLPIDATASTKSGRFFVRGRGSSSVTLLAGRREECLLLGNGDNDEKATPGRETLAKRALAKFRRVDNINNKNEVDGCKRACSPMLSLPASTCTFIEGALRMSRVCLSKNVVNFYWSPRYKRL